MESFMISHTIFLNKIIRKVIYLLAMSGTITYLYADGTGTVLATTLTLYKNGALIYQGQTLPLSSGKHRMQIPGIANSIIKESLMLSLSAQPKEAKIEESVFIKSDNDNNLILDLLVNSKVNEPKSYINLTYLLRNMSWKPHYAIQFRSGYQYLFFNGSVEIINTSGILFKKAQIQFVDSSLPEAQENNADKLYANAKGYSYKAPLDLSDNQPKRLNWISSKDTLKPNLEYRISVGGEYLKDMDNKPASPVIETWVSFSNTAENNLGQDLPPGVAVLYYQDEQGKLEILGRTQIAHTGIGQEISVRIPSTQIDKIEKGHSKESKSIEALLEQNQFISASNTAQYCLKLKNSSKTPVTIRVVLDLPNDVENCTIIRDTIPHVKSKNKPNENKHNDADATYWNITIPAEGDVQLKYQLSFIKTSK